MNTEPVKHFVNEVNEKEVQDISRVLISLLTYDSSVNTKDDLKGIGIIVSFVSGALEEIMQSHIVKSKQDRLKVIKFIDKLKQQKYAIELFARNRNDLQLTSERLGRKAQSSFSYPKTQKK